MRSSSGRRPQEIRENPKSWALHTEVPGPRVVPRVARYLGSVTFAGLAPTTRAKRRDVLERFRRERGDKRIEKLRPDHVGNLLPKLRPFAQRNVLKVLRALMVFALSISTVSLRHW
jgi:hypothetical protein